MRRSQRYEIVSTWQQVERFSPSESLFATTEASQILATREVADIRDIVGGHIYTDGAYRVKAKYGDGQSYRRAKTFYGEMAWADSQRMFNDIVSEVQNQERWVV